RHDPGGEERRQAAPELHTAACQECADHARNDAVAERIADEREAAQHDEHADRAARDPENRELDQRASRELESEGVEQECDQWSWSWSACPAPCGRAIGRRGVPSAAIPGSSSRPNGP